MTDPHEQFEEFLRRKGLKYTTERREILDAILAQDDHFEVEELLFAMRQDGKRVSRATIYRAVELFCEGGLLMRVELGRNQIRYEHTFKKDHPGFHHHLVCRVTGNIQEFNSPELEDLIRRICAENGFHPEHMRLVVTGLSDEGRRVLDTAPLSGPPPTAGGVQGRPVAPPASAANIPAAGGSAPSPPATGSTVPPSSPVGGTAVPPRSAETSVAAGNAAEGATPDSPGPPAAAPSVTEPSRTFRPSPPATGLPRLSPPPTPAPSREPKLQPSVALAGHGAGHGTED